MGKSRKKTSRSSHFLQRDGALAEAAVRASLQALRESFTKPLAISLLAPFLNMTPRKFRGITYAHCGYKELLADTALRMGATRAKRWYADYLRQRASYWDAVADQEECHGTQLTLWREGRSTTTSLERRAA